MTYKDQLYQILAKGETGRVIKELFSTTNLNGQKDLNGRLLLISSRYHRNEKDKDLMDLQDYKIECNKIEVSLKIALEAFHDDGSIPELQEKPDLRKPVLAVDKFKPLETHPAIQISYDEKSFPQIEGLIRQNLILLVTATETETSGLHQKMTALPDEKGLLEVRKGNATYFIGKFGNFLVAHVECGTMGTGSSMGSLITITNALNDLNPKFALMVGIAFGIDPNKQNIGDVLVSQTIIPYEIQRVSEDGIVWRGAQPEASNFLRNAFKNLRNWGYTLPNQDAAQLDLCDILSGEKLVDNLNFRNALEKQFPTAKGGEMEGAGLYAACQDKRVEWILVKSICDFADGKKKEGKKEKQALAIDTALSACLQVFNKKHVFEGLGLHVYEGNGSSKTLDSTTLTAFKTKLLALLGDNQQNAIADVLVQIKESDYEFDKVKYTEIATTTTFAYSMNPHAIVQSAKILIHSLKEKRDSLK